MTDEKETKRGTELKTKRKINIWMVLTIILIIALIGIIGAQVSGMFVFNNNVSNNEVLSSEEVGDATLNFINENLVQPGTTATLVSVESFKGIYNVTISYLERNVNVFVTKDGNYIFLSQPMDMTEEIPQPEEQQEEEQQPEELQKADTPEVHAFVMSYCPYGLQFMKAYISVMELIGDEAELELNFVHYAMHGKKEIDENTRMYCIQKEQNDKFTEYLRCFVEDGDYEKCISEVGIDETKLESCIDSTDEQFNITGLYNDKSTWLGNYPPYLVDGVLAQQFNVRGSPTFVVNGKTLSVQRSPEAIKAAICSAFNTPPSECEQTLSTKAESPGLGPIGAGSGSSSEGQC